MTDAHTNGATQGGSSAVAARDDENSRLDALLDRIHQLTVAQSPPKRPQADIPAASAAATEPHCEAAPARTPVGQGGEWFPLEPESLNAAGLTDGEVEALILKTLNGRAEATGRYLSEHLKVAFRIIDPLKLPGLRAA